MNIYEKLSNIQSELKAPKGQYNSYGGYKYRSCEDILEAVKPICKKYNTVLVLGDALKNIGDRYYIEATASLIDMEDLSNGVISVSNTAYAREEESKKGMDGSQITGTASSYARKYALNGLFNIDDTKDADTDEFTKQTDEDIKINKVKSDLLNQAIKENHISDEVVELILSEYGYKTIGDIKVKDYMSIIKDFKAKLNKEDK